MMSHIQVLFLFYIKFSGNCGDVAAFAFPERYYNITSQYDVAKAIIRHFIILVPAKSTLALHTTNRYTLLFAGLVLCDPVIVTHT